MQSRESLKSTLASSICTRLVTCLDRTGMSAYQKLFGLLSSYPSKAYVYAYNEPKKKGGKRPIARPNKELKKWLRAVNDELGRLFFEWPEFMHGGIKKRSYVTYARPHINRKCVITVDIKGCFDAITQKEISKSIQKHLSLTSSKSDELAARLCFHGRVPQGFPTSNFLCNLYLLDTLTVLYESFKKQELIFANYVDDIVVSGDIKSPAKIVNEIAIGLSRANLKMNKTKVEIMPRSGRQVVCGLVVNRRLSLTRQMRARLLSDVSRHEMGEATLAGWLVNLRNVDPTFRQKLRLFATKHGYK